QKGDLFRGRLPVVATDRYAWQMSRANRPQAARVGSGADAGPVRPGANPGPGEVAPLPKKRPAQTFLNTPACAPAPVDSGRNAFVRSFQVISGTIASTRSSYAARSNARAPPYEPPTAATRGAPRASFLTSGRVVVRYLPVGAVDVDLTAAAAEPFSGPRQHRIAAPGQLPGVRGDAVLGAAEPVRQ